MRRAPQRETNRPQYGGPTARQAASIGQVADSATRVKNNKNGKEQFISWDLRKSTNDGAREKMFPGGKRRDYSSSSSSSPSSMSSGEPMSTDGEGE